MLYRQSLLDKLKSPERLDCMQDIKSPMNILVLIGCALFITAAAVVIVLV